jgi:hypothetical protein
MNGAPLEALAGLLEQLELASIVRNKAEHEDAGRGIKRTFWSVGDGTPR